MAMGIWISTWPVMDEVVSSINRTDGQANGFRLELFRWEDDVTPRIGPKPQQAWFVPRDELHEVTEGVKQHLRKGRNVLAATCHQTYGGQYIDVGMVLDPKQELLVPAPLPPIEPLFDYPVRDTSICVGGDGNYYLTGTTGDPTWWKTNEGVRVWKSPDLKNWELLGLVWKIEQGTWQKEMHGDHRALWAPEIHYLKGTFWITFCMNFGGTGLLKSTTGKAEVPLSRFNPPSSTAYLLGGAGGVAV